MRKGGGAKGVKAEVVEMKGGGFITADHNGRKVHDEADL